MLPNPLALSEDDYPSETVEVYVSDGNDWIIDGVTSTTVSGRKLVNANSSIKVTKEIYRDPATSEEN